MSQPRFKFRPEVSPLESRVALSGASAAPALQLNGTLQGTYTITVNQLSKNKAQYTVVGDDSGEVSPLGQVHQHYTLHGKSQNQIDVKTIKLIGQNGSVRAALNGNTSGTFEITGGTGAYRKATGTGTFTVTFKLSSYQQMKHGFKDVFAITIDLTS